VFYINVPVGLIATWLSIRFIPRDPVSEHAERFDKAGAAAFSIGLVTLLLALNQGSAWGWSSPLTWAILGLAALLLTTFVVIEKRVASPMLDLSLFRNRLFSAAASSALLNYICVYTITFLLPFYLIQGRGLEAAQAGLVLTAQPLVMAITAPLSGTVSDRIGSRIPSMLGMAILALGLFILSRLGIDSPLALVVAGLATAGLGVGIFVSPNNSALMGAAPRHRQGIASGVLATSRNLGMVLGVGLAGAIFTTIFAPDPLGGNTPLLFAAIDAGFAAATGIAVLSIFTAAIR
jgi:predicted MFS family arabinose efflux permease